MLYNLKLEATIQTY